MHHGYGNMTVSNSEHVFFFLACYPVIYAEVSQVVSFLEDFQTKFLYEFRIFSMRAVCSAQYFLCYYYSVYLSKSYL